MFVANKGIASTSRNHGCCFVSFYALPVSHLELTDVPMARKRKEIQMVLSAGFPKSSYRGIVDFHSLGLDIVFTLETLLEWCLKYWLSVMVVGLFGTPRTASNEVSLKAKYHRGNALRTNANHS